MDEGGCYELYYRCQISKLRYLGKIRMFYWQQHNVSIFSRLLMLRRSIVITPDFLHCSNLKQIARCLWKPYKVAKNLYLWIW